MEILHSYSDAYIFELFKGNLYIGGQNKLIQISKIGNNEKIIRHTGKISIMKKHFDLLFFQEDPKEVFTYDEFSIKNPFKGKYSLRNSRIIKDEVWINRIDTKKNDNEYIVHCCFNKNLTINELEIPVQFQLPYLDGILYKGFRSTIEGFNKDTLKKEWSFNVSNMGTQFHGIEERKNVLAGGLSDSILPYKDRVIMALAGGQILSLYVKTGEICFFTETSVRSNENGIRQLSILDNKIYGQNAHYIVELDANTGKELRRLDMKEVIDQGIFMNQFSVFDDYMIGYTTRGNIVMVNRHTFKIEEIFQSKGSIPNRPKHVIWFNNRLYIQSSDMFLEKKVIDGNTIDNVVRKDTIHVYQK